MREIREQIDSGEVIDWGSVNAVVTAVVFKDFLRSLPDCLLGAALYEQWLQVATTESQDQALDKIKTSVFTFSLYTSAVSRLYF